MAATLLFGAGSGALHAVTGPDHVLSLGPVALQHPRASWRIGLTWGAGHALGTLLLALPVLLIARAVHLEAFAAWADRLAGVALIATAAWSWWSARRCAGEAARGREPLLVGLVHGLTGAGSLLLVLPVLVAGSTERTILFLLAFAGGSAVAMAGLTSTIARLGARLEARWIARSQAWLTAAAVGVGAWWLVGA